MTSQQESPDQALKEEEPPTTLSLLHLVLGIKKRIPTIRLAQALHVDPEELLPSKLS